MLSKKERRSFARQGWPVRNWTLISKKDSKIRRITLTEDGSLTKWFCTVEVSIPGLRRNGSNVILSDENEIRSSLDELSKFVSSRSTSATPFSDYERLYDSSTWRFRLSVSGENEFAMSFIFLWI